MNHLALLLEKNSLTHYIEYFVKILMSVPLMSHMREGAINGVTIVQAVINVSVRAATPTVLYIAVVRQMVSKN